MNPDEPFYKVVLRYWIAAMTGSVFAALWTVAGFFGAEIPQNAAWVFIVGGIVAAIWLAGQFAHGEYRKLAHQLKPEVEYAGIDDSAPGQRLSSHPNSELFRANTAGQNPIGAYRPAAALHAVAVSPSSNARKGWRRCRHPGGWQSDS